MSPGHSRVARDSKSRGSPLLEVFCSPSSLPSAPVRDRRGPPSRTQTPFGASAPPASTPLLKRANRRAKRGRGPSLGQGVLPRSGHPREGRGPTSSPHPRRPLRSGATTVRTALHPSLSRPQTHRPQGKRGVLLQCGRCGVIINAKVTIRNGRARINEASLPCVASAHEAAVEDARRAWLAAEQRHEPGEAIRLRGIFRHLAESAPTERPSDFRTHAGCGGSFRLYSWPTA